MTQPASSPWSLKIATVAGIPIRLHWTFILFMAWLGLLANQAPDFAPVALLIPALFVCVLLHELGHALTAKHYGIRTRDITLYPIGGVAMIVGRPTPPQEFWIAVAGPAVNVVIAGILGLSHWAVLGSGPHFQTEIKSGPFLHNLFSVNIMLAVFNLIPAFPMDGGRVLRALLAMRMPLYRATWIAGRLGQFIAIGFGFFGLWIGHLILLLIAIFVYLGAEQEMMATLGYSLVSGRKVRDAMMTNFRTISHSDTLETVSKILLEGSQQDFPVTLGDEVLGLLTRDDLIRGIMSGEREAYVGGHMRREFRRLSPEDPLELALEGFASRDRGAILVMDGDRLIGMVTPDNLAEFMMLEHARLGA
jgi:Zn-dependent protease